MRNRILACLAASLSISFAADRVTLTGKVTDSSGKPLEDATVMIYRASLRKGYGTLCPSCYADCGKRAVTDQTGSYTISGLDPKLLLELVVVRDGYAGAYARGVDPRGRAPIVALAPRVAADDPNRVALGRVLDANGRPLADAVVFSHGVATTVE